MKRTATAVWNGSGKEGKGNLTTQSTTLSKTQYSFSSRFEEGVGTNPEELVGKQVAAIVNFPPKQIANFFSECLVLGVYTDKNEVVLLRPEREVENGWKVG